MPRKTITVSVRVLPHTLAALKKIAAARGQKFGPNGRCCRPVNCTLDDVIQLLIRERQQRSTP